MVPMVGRRLVVLAAVFASGCLFGLSGDVAARDAKKLVAAGAVLLDVRTPAEYAEKHIDGAVNIPVQELASRLDEVGPRERPVVVYCRSGHRAAKAAAMLREAGFTQVHDLGAMSRWPD